MFFPRFIKWLAGLPAPYGLALLWWIEVTVLLCSLAGGYFLSGFLFENIAPRYQDWLFPAALVTYLLVFYIIHFEFGKISQLMEALMHIHRMGGLPRIERLRQEELKEIARMKDSGGESEGKTEKDIYDPLEPPRRIRASAQVFQTRYFVVLPSAFLLYLLSFAGTIYRIFTRQIQSWDPAGLALPVLAAVAVACACYWLLMPWLPGYVSVRSLLGHKPVGGD
jgi:hypothetical protein